MSVFLIAAVTTIAVVMGFCVFRNKKKGIESRASDIQIGAQESAGHYGDWFDSLLGPGDDNEVTKEEEPKDTVLKLENRSWWRVSRYTVLSYLFIIVVAIFIFILSMLSYSAYNGRKHLEQAQTDSLRMEREKSNQLFLDNEEARKDLLEAKLDSIDLHIQALKPVKNTSSRKKQKK